MIRLLLSFGLFLLLATAALADTKDMAPILLKPSDVLRGHFTEERHLKGLSAPLISAGHFVVAPQQGLIWALDKPFQTTTVMTPQGLVQLINNDQVTYLPSQKMPFMRHLYDTLGGSLTGDWQALTADFTMTQKTDTLGWQVTLIPRTPDNPAMPFSLITIRGRSFVDHVVMTKPDGDTDVIDFSHETLTTAAPTTAESRLLSSVHP